jgi:hypothetical protein
MTSSHGYAGEIEMKASTNGRAVQTTGYPMVCLVDVDGHRVGVGEKDIPDVHREPCPADAWPAWTDIVAVRLGRQDFDIIQGAWKVVDMFRETVRRSERPVDFDTAMEEYDGEDLALQPADYRDPHDWPEADSPEPTDEDWESYRQHLNEVEKLYGYE